jgi:hypothetical protein
VGRKLAATIGVGLTCLAMAACGGDGGGSSAPSADTIEACLSGAGLKAELLKEAEGMAAIGAQAPDGDLIVIVTVPEEVASEYDVSGIVTRRIKRELRAIGRGGIWTSSTVNGGSTYIGALGVAGVAGGLASASTEILARQCATKPPAAAKAPDTPEGTEA